MYSNDDIRARFAQEHKQNDGALRRMKASLRTMTNQQAIKAGRTVQRAEERVRSKEITKQALKDIIADSPFKYIPVFTEYFGEDWDLLSRIATDPAHEVSQSVCLSLSLSRQ